MRVKHKVKQLGAQVVNLEAALVSANEKATHAKAKALEGKAKKALEDADKKNQVLRLVVNTRDNAELRQRKWGLENVDIEPHE